MPKDGLEMTAHDVIEVLQLFQQNHIDVCIDGGWGVDALLGKQTRKHADLDIAIPHKDVAQLRALLEARGYEDVPRDDTRECNFVLGDDQGHQIDIHTYAFDAAGNNLFGVEYPYDSLQGSGSVNGHPVKCISPEWMVKFHTGYKLDEDDCRDVLALCQHFGIEMPSEYEGFERRKLEQMSITFDELYQKAKSVLNPRRLSEDAEAGGVGAALLSDGGQVYVGVCIDTGSSMGFCAEHAAAGAMVTAGENRVLRMIAVGWDGHVMPPCGRCREFISQLHDDNMDAEVMVGEGVIVRLRELLPYNGRSPAEATT